MSPPLNHCTELAVVVVARRSTKAIDASNCQLIAAAVDDGGVVVVAEDLAAAHGWG